MNQIGIALLSVASFVLVVDLVVTHLRQRARRAAAPSEAQLAEELEHRTEEGVALEHE